MRKGMSVLPVLASYAVSAAVFSQLPPTVTLDLSSLGTSTADTMPRQVVAVLIPTLGLAVWGLLLTLAKVRGPVRPLPEWWLNEQTGAKATTRFEPTYNTVAFAVTALICLAHVGLIAQVLEWPWWIYRILTATLGAGFLAVGNVMPRVRPNWIVGIRTKRTLSDPASWAKVHRLLGASLMVLGGLVMLISLVSGRYALLVAVAGLLPAFAVSHWIGTSSRRTSMLLMAVSLVFLSAGSRVL